MLWATEAKGTLGGWGVICLVLSLLLQCPGVHTKCYFQAQGKVERGLRKGCKAKGTGGQNRGQRGLGGDPVSEYPDFLQL